MAASAPRPCRSRPDTFTPSRASTRSNTRDAARTARLHARIVERTQHLHRLAAESQGSQLLAGVLPALGKLFELRLRLSAAEFTKAFDATYRGFKAAERRLRELVESALDEPAMHVLADQARAAGFADVRFAPLSQDAEFLVGWQLDMRAAPAAGR